MPTAMAKNICDMNADVWSVCDRKPFYVSCEMRFLVAVYGKYAVNA